MEAITRLEFWKLEEEIRQNNHLKISGPLSMSVDPRGKIYYSGLFPNAEIWLKINKDGYFVDSRFLELLK